MGSRPTVNAEVISARIERLPFTPFHARSLSMVGAAHFFDAFDALTIAFVLPSLIAGWGMSPTQAGLVVSIGYAGQTIGAIAIGWATERWGRLRMVAFSCWILGALSLVSAMAVNPGMFMALRFVQGIGLGGEVPAAAIYINEISSARLRGRMVFMIQTIFAAAVAGTALLALWMIPKFGWPSMYIAGGTPILLAIVIRRLLPESPRWLAGVGRLNEADAIVTAIELEYETRRNRVLPEPTPVAMAPALTPTPAPTPRAGILSLLAPQFRSRTLSVWLMAFCISLTGYGMLVWMPTLYRTVFRLPMDHALAYGAISNVASLLGAITGIALIDFIGRRTLFILAFLGSTVPLVFLWWKAPGIEVTYVAGISAIGMFFISILLTGIYVYAPEIYPTRIRGVGAGAASSWLRVASIAGPLVIGGLLQNRGFGAVFLLLGIAAAVGAITTFCFGIETRGKPLEEIAQ